MSELIGKPVDRVDGRLKVTGAARYAAEFPLPNLAHAVAIQSTIARGRIESIDTSAAEKSPGVLAVITHLNAPKLATTDPSDVSERWRRVVPVLQSNRIDYYGQHIGVVVAETLEQAQHAASLVRVTYAQERPVLSWEANLNRAYAPPQVNGNNPTDTRHGDIERGWREADVTIDATYTTPFEHHNPMEPHATTAVWEGDNLTLYNSTQYPVAAQLVVARTLRIPEQSVRIVNPFMGGGGSKVATRGHVILAAIAAKQINRPVKLVVTRQQMFTSVGHRTNTQQRVRLGAKRDGRLTAIAHESIMHTSTFDEFAEQTGVASRIMYECPNSLVTHLEVRQGHILSQRNSSLRETYQEVLARNNLKEVTAEVNFQPGEAAKKYSMHAFGAHFAQVRVDPDTGEVRVPRFLSVHAAGRILNPKTARSQILGGVVWGISMALHEETHIDSRYGHFVNHDLAEYHVPVNADIGDIDAFFVAENDPHVNPLGSKGIGEIGIVGAAAVANALYHATGKRIRDLPITPDKLL